jgi:flagellum-specific peptidoglycan hydrolase FlgJ
MKLHKFDEKNLTYSKVKNKTLIFFLIVIVTSTTLIGVVIHDMFSSKINTELMAIVLRNDADKDEFDIKKFKNYLNELNIKYPHIVIAQARLETNNFNSHIFKENHNLFGMKVATRRPTTNKGEDNGHAYYNNWKESVIDYALYSATYLNSLKSEDDYFNFLSRHYAEDTNYVNKLKKIIEKH